jgi:hypothetical protein
MRRVHQALSKIFCRSPFIDIRDGASRASGRNLMTSEFSPLNGPRASKFSRHQALRSASAQWVQPSFPVRNSSPQ